jgi:predicted secreted protein
MALQVNNKTTIYGDRLELTFGGKPLAFGKSCSLEITAETLDTSNKMSGNWKDFLVGQLSFSVSTDSLLTYSKNAEVADLANVSKFGDLLATMVNRNPIQFSLSEITKVEGENGSISFNKEMDLVTGNVVITQLSVQADNGQITTCAISLQGTGELKIGENFAGTAIADSEA